MALSFSQTESLTCPQCKTPFDAEIWLIVDAGERPDLAARCHDGSIHVVTCPNGHSGMLGAPLLYHDRAKQQLFLTYPQGMSEQQVQDAGKQLLRQLRGQLLILPGSSYLDAPQAIPIELLPAAMDDKLDEVMAQLQARMEQLEQLRQNPAVAAALRVLQEQQTLVATLQEWIATDAWNASKEFLETHPELLTDDAELVLAAMLDLARAQDDADAQEDIQVHREILRAARTNGIDAAFEKYLARGAPTETTSDARAELQARLEELNIHSQADLERALPDHPELQALMQRVMRDENPILQAINKLVPTRSPQEVIQLARAYPALLDDEGLNALREIISNARQRGDDDMANHLQERLAVLEQIKASGMRVEELAQQAAVASFLDDETRAAIEELRALGITNEQELQAALETRPDLRAKLEALAQRAAPSNNLGDIPDDVRPLLQEMSRLTRLSDMPRKVELCRAALERVPRAQNPNLWAALQNELGNALNQNPQGSRADNLEEAIRHYELALEVRTRAAFPEQWASTQNNLANAYADRIRGERADNLEEAIRHYELALEVYTREAFPEQWASTQNNLANAYAERIRGERADNLEEAIRHYELALEVRTRAAFPEQWASTQNNLATAYRNRIRGERVDTLEEAIRHYELALEVYTREAFPSDWAGTQNNLANAYAERIRGERADNLEEAIRHYELALEVRTRAAFPEQWASTQNNLATAYLNRIRGERADNLEEAIRHYELALEVYTRAAFPEQWASTQNNLATAYRNRIRGERVDNLEEAIRHYELALEVYTREAFPEQWATTQNNLAKVHRPLAVERANKAEAVGRFVEAAKQVVSARATYVVERLDSIEQREYAQLGLTEALLLKRAGELLRAIDALQRTFKEFQKIGDAEAQGNICLEMGHVARMMDSYEDAWIHYSDAYRLFKRTGNKKMMAVAREERGSLEFLFKAPDAASDFEEAYQLYTESGEMARARDVGHKVHEARSVYRSRGEEMQ